MQHNTGRQAGNNGCRSDKMFGVNRLGLVCRDDAEHTTRTQPPDSATVPIFNLQPDVQDDQAVTDTVLPKRRCSHGV